MQARPRILRKAMPFAPASAGGLLLLAVLLALGRRPVHADDNTGEGGGVDAGDLGFGPGAPDAAGEAQGEASSDTTAPPNLPDPAASTTTTALNFVCDSLTQYTCSGDGICININYLCDDIVDCNDGEDEAPGAGPGCATEGDGISGGDTGEPGSDDPYEGFYSTDDDDVS